MHNHGPWGDWHDHSFGRWWAHLPYDHAFGANLVSDFFEQENLTFSQWLAWLRRWMWALDKRMGQIDNRIVSLENRQLVTENTPSIDWETEGAWEAPTMEWDPQLNQMTWTFPENILTKRANVHLSKATEERELSDPANGKEWKWNAENATEIKTDGVYTPDDTLALNYLYNNVNDLWEEVEDQGEASGVKHLASDMSVGEFSQVTTLAINTPYKQIVSGVNNIFFDVAKGYYFVSNSHESVLYMFNRSGDFMARVILNLLPGHVIESISNFFVTYDDTIRGWHIEVGCTNEVAFLFDLLEDEVNKVVLDHNKDVTITEYDSMETFYTVIGSDNTWLRSSPFMKQKITVWNTKSGAFATTDRQNWYNAGPVDILLQTSKFVGEKSKASADMYGRVLATTGNKAVEMYTIEVPEDATKPEMALKSTMNTSTLEVATTKAADGSKYGNDKASVVYPVIAIQVLNQAKRQNFRDSEFTVLAVTEPHWGDNSDSRNDDSVYTVYALGNSVSSVKNVLLDGTNPAMDDKFLEYLNANQDKSLAGISMRGSFSLPELYAGGFDPLDGPDKQTSLKGILNGWNRNARVVLENSAMLAFEFTQTLTYTRTGDSVNAPFSKDVPVTLVRQVRLAVGNNGGFKGQWTVLDAQWITDNVTKFNNTDVGNHLSLSSDKNTLTLSRKKLDGTVVASDNVNVQLGEIWNIINNLKGGDIETTETIWTGNLSEGQALPISLSMGAYDLGVHSDDIGAYIVRIIWSPQSPINHNSIISPYVPANSDGSFWIMQPKLTNASKPVFTVTMVKYDHATQTSSVKNSGNNCQLTSVKRVVVKHIG